MADDNSRVTLKARFVFPGEGPAIAGGTVTIDGDRIVAVGQGRSNSPVRDLGQVAILPGFVNAHTHLEFSDLSHPIGQPGMPLPDWIRALIARRRMMAGSGFSAVAQGWQESLAAGTTTLGEIATSDYRDDSRVVDCAATDTTMFFESIAPIRERIAAAAAAAETFLSRKIFSPRIAAALSPHAPYTVHPELLERMVDLSRRFQVPLAMHLAESPEENELLKSASGPFRDLLTDLQSWDPHSDARYPRVLDYLEQLARAPRALAVHGNYLDATELSFLAAHAETMAVVYCPRTHYFFRHRPYPLKAMLDLGIALALGTDSRASNPDLSLLAEMKFVAAHHPEVSPAKILELGTLGGAKALGVANQVGTITAGKLANLVVVELAPCQAEDPHELVLDPRARVVETWVRGQAVYRAADF